MLISQVGCCGASHARVLKSVKGRLKKGGGVETLSDGLENEIGFVWDGSHLLQEVYANGRYTYIYTDVDSYEPLAQIHNYTNEEFESKQEINYFHCDQIGIPCEMTDKDGNLLWFGEYDAWGKLTEETNVTSTAHQPFRLQNQYCDRETGLHYNFFRYYEPNVGRFVNQDPIGLLGRKNVYGFALNSQIWIDPLGLYTCESRCTQLSQENCEALRDLIQFESRHGKFAAVARYNPFNFSDEVLDSVVTIRKVRLSCITKYLTVHP